MVVAIVPTTSSCASGIRGPGAPKLYLCERSDDACPWKGTIILKHLHSETATLKTTRRIITHNDRDILLT